MQLDTRRAITPPAIGRTGFPALLIERGLTSRNDLLVAEQHAEREHMDLVEAIVALGLVPEAESYAAVAAAAGLAQVDLAQAVSSELAVRLVPERLARRYFVVPLSVDNRTLTYATCRPFDSEAERDLSFASGRRTSAVVARRSTVLDALDRCYPRLRELDLLAARLSAERPVVEVSVAGIAEHGQRGDGVAAHGVDVAEGIGGGDGSERVGVVHDGREEIDGLHQGVLRRQLVDAGIVGGIEAYQHVIVSPARDAREHLVQNLRTELGRSTGGGGVGSQLLGHSPG